MTEPLTTAGDSLPSGPAPDSAAPRSGAPGGTGPGVPLSIWPGLPAHGGARDGEPCGGPVTAAAARRVIDTFSLPGDLVAVGSPAVIEAAAAAGRPVLTLAPGPAPGRHRPGVLAALPPPGDPDAGTAGLAVAGCCGPGCCGRQPGSADRRQDPGLVFAACERVLRPGGILAVIAGAAAPGGTTASTASTAGSVVAAARAAGLVYAQHIILVRAAIDGDRLTPAAPGPAALGGSPVHDDLFVFTKPGAGARP